MSYSMELLQSDDAKEVLGGSRILKTLVEHDPEDDTLVEHVSKDDTLRRIGMKSGNFFTISHSCSYPI